MARKLGWNYKQECEKKLDNRDEFFRQLEAFENKHGYIDAEFANDSRMMKQYELWKKNKSWRNDKKLVKKINRRNK